MRNFIKFIDDLCKNITFYIFYFFKIILFPFKILVGLVTFYFSRPYSFFFLIDFILLIPSSLLLTILAIQYFEFINSVDKLNKIFYFTLSNSIVNYILVFHIYYLYGVHTLETKKFDSNIKEFVRFTIDYLFNKTKLGFFGIYFILQIIFYIVTLIYINSKDEYYSEAFEAPVVIYFTIFSILLNLSFVVLHVTLYTFLFFIILCRINKSCILNILTGTIGMSDYKRIEFYNLALDFYEFIGIYQYRLMLTHDKEVEIV